VHNLVSLSAAALFLHDGRQMEVSYATELQWAVNIRGWSIVNFPLSNWRRMLVREDVSCVHGNGSSSSIKGLYFNKNG
jgi:hypothetical protein